MEATRRIELALSTAVGRAEASGGPPQLAAAMRYAVFPGGARIRPRLALAVATACGEDDTGIADAAAASIELLHCASLIHDDLPCFDDAPIRRGKPSVHAAFGERLAVLAGDALIVLAFQTLAHGAATSPQRLASLSMIVGRAVGAPLGIVAGQAWECEQSVELRQYQRSKTGALFAASTLMGAASAGSEPNPWRALGERLGEAYQIADDIRDVIADPEEIGKPTGRDCALGRPSAPEELGMAGANERLEELVDGAVGAIPACPGQAELRAIIVQEARAFFSRSYARRAA
jgi:geranylgeranyl diphosphate synthase, type II